MQWIGLLLPIAQGDRETEKIAVVPYDHHDGRNQLLALHRSANILRICIVTAETRAEAETEAEHVFKRRRYAAQRVQLETPNSDGTLYHMVRSEVERAMINNNGVQVLAAMELGVTARVINDMLRRFDLEHWRTKRPAARMAHRLRYGDE